MSERKLVISRHAVAAYSRRRNDSRSLKALADADWDPRKVPKKEERWHLIELYNELEEEIRECVSYSLAKGLVLDHKPPGFVLYGRKKAGLPPGQRFVRCDEDSNFGFILKRVEDEDIVVTTLTKAGVRR